MANAVQQRRPQRRPQGTAAARPRIRPTPRTNALLDDSRPDASNALAGPTRHTDEKLVGAGGEGGVMNQHKEYLMIREIIAHN